MVSVRDAKAVGNAASHHLALLARVAADQEDQEAHLEVATLASPRSVVGRAHASPADRDVRIPEKAAVKPVERWHGWASLRTELALVVVASSELLREVVLQQPLAEASMEVLSAPSETAGKLQEGKLLAVRGPRRWNPRR